MEDSLDSLLEDAGLEGAISEDGMDDLLCCCGVISSLAVFYYVCTV